MSPRHSLLVLLGVLLPLLLLVVAAPTSALVLRTPEAAIAKAADPGLQLDSISHHHIHRHRQLHRQKHTPVSRSDGAVPLILPRNLNLSPTLADSPAISATTSPITTTTSAPPSIKPRRSRRTTTPPSPEKQKRQEADIGAGIDGLSKRTKIIVGVTIATVFAALILMCVVRDQMGKDPCPCQGMPIECPAF